MSPTLARTLRFAPPLLALHLLATAHLLGISMSYAEEIPEDAAEQAQAAGYGDLSSLFSGDGLLSDAMTNAVVKTAGLCLDHRAYEPATPLGTKIGLNIGVEATITKPPADLATALSENAATSGTSAPPIIPLPRLQLHKGLGERAGIGISLIAFQGYKIYGGDIKLAVAQPEEGPTVAIRMSINKTSVGYVSTTTYSPQILMSRVMSFADPYIGMGYQYAMGTVTVPLGEVQGVDLGVIEKSGSAGGFLAFTGVQFRVSAVGLALTLEGAYSSAGVHQLGTKFGFAF